MMKVLSIGLTSLFGLVSGATLEKSSGLEGANRINLNAVSSQQHHGRIGGGLLRALSKRRKEKHSQRQFFLRRFHRSHTKMSFKDNQHVYEPTFILDKLRALTGSGIAQLAQEVDREQAAVVESEEKLSKDDKVLLEGLLETTDNDNLQMMELLTLYEIFVSNMKGVLGMETNAASCKNLVCGKDHTECVEPVHEQEEGNGMSLVLQKLHRSIKGFELVEARLKATTGSGSGVAVAEPTEEATEGGVAVPAVEVPEAPLHDNTSPKCVCEKGYVGNGYSCSTPTSFTPVTVGDQTEQITSLDVIKLGNTDLVAVVYAGKGGKGFVRVGQKKPDHIDWSATATGFSISSANHVKAFYHFGQDALVITYVDESQKGIMAFGTVENMQFSLVSSVVFGRNQNQVATVISAGPATAIVFYSSVIEDGEMVEKQGKAALYKLDRTASAAKGSLAMVVGPAPPGSGSGGSGSGSSVAPVIIKPQGLVLESEYAFHDGEVSDITALEVADSKFIVGFRSMAADRMGNQAILTLGRVASDGIVFFFSDTVLKIHPEKGDELLGHSLALVSANRVSLTFYSLATGETEVALVNVLPTSLALANAEEGFYPRAIDKPGGNAKFVTEQVSAPFVLNGGVPRVIFYYGTGRNPRQLGGNLEVCDVAESSAAVLSCAKHAYAGDHNVLEARAAPLGDGKMVFLFTDRTKKMWYEIVTVETDEEGEGATE